MSFAGEQRTYVEDVARALQSRGISVFYDQFELVELWGMNLVEAFHDVFENSSACAVMFISENYIEKAWPTHERRSILSRAVQEKHGFVIPVRFDKTPVPGLPSATMYLCADDYVPTEMAVLIAEKIGVKKFEGKASAVPPPRTTSLFGEVVFDYSRFSGSYVIGRGKMEFETKWSKASDRAIHVYNYPSSINGVARALGCTDITMVSNAEKYDYTSRSQTISQREVAILRNTHGFYAAVHILDIKDGSRNDNRDELRFRYIIQKNDSDSFNEFNNISKL